MSLLDGVVVFVAVALANTASTLGLAAFVASRNKRGRRQQLMLLKEWQDRAIAEGRRQKRQDLDDPGDVGRVAPNPDSIGPDRNPR